MVTCRQQCYHSQLFCGLGSYLGCIAVVGWVGMAYGLVGASSFMLSFDAVALKVVVGYLFGLCSIWTDSHEGSSLLCGPFGHIAYIVPFIVFPP